MLLRKETAESQRASASWSAATQRTFLVVVDNSAEMRVALRYASRRAQNTGGRVALMIAIEQTEFEQWMFVGNLMREEAREGAEQSLQRHAAAVGAVSGERPSLFVREGDRIREVFKLVNEEPSISVLVLGVGADPNNPGPLVRELTGRQAGKLRVPVTLVPGGLSDAEIDALA
ncbi:universal stress protein [Rhodospirillum rubrum]|uniref:Conserved hypothetical cytosolic protein n=1 Tax=Rhodospirillum rubrum (strain ATCC 11170 / ATH 1.1.1 / DSM 467 / LMG 4362 / NCIMB 8255 / S1) TaxID=269796 RepID=Q2RRE4_RHORT|nr:universal stress protein [Rhodospirillum rubrum]ABC23301.1 conserved hypothetical cytosolic protein [Rhodospirillum rubrum ATCC 11170]AEO49034.1 hypothetical protein F11_12850 [Rhodospirillum rubrum F11]MBK5954917.1 universal stress protein [Rhodospirillum rubrum]QXG79275.1 universal stress protein [Rhodospirillum rubrum]HCF19518.1 universal stress protein [Rhodospirillum rubrum]